MRDDSPERSAALLRHPNTAEEQDRRAVHQVLRHSHNPEDARLLLDALGLTDTARRMQ